MTGSRITSRQQSGTRKKIIAVIITLVAMTFAAHPATSRGAGAGPVTVSTGPGGSHVHFYPPARSGSFKGPQVLSTTSQLLYNGGDVMHADTNYVIFWQPTGFHFDASDSSYENLITRYFNDVGGTDFFNLLTQYSVWTGASDVLGGPILNQSSLASSFVDTNAFPLNGCSDTTTFYSNCLVDAQLQSEIARVASQNGWAPNLTSEFFIYLPQKVMSCFTSLVSGGCTDASKYPSTAYCAYHSGFVSGTSDFIYAAMPNDADPLGGGYSCEAYGNGQALKPNGDVAADSEISTTSHEQFESVSESFFGVNGAYKGWVDQYGSEIGDKCAYVWGTLQPDGSNVNLNGNHYIVQEEWSNLAATSTQSGCSLSLPRSGPGEGPTATPIATRVPA